MGTQLQSLGDAVRHVNLHWNADLASEARHVLTTIKTLDDRVRVELDENGFAVFYLNKENEANESERFQRWRSENAWNGILHDYVPNFRMPNNDLVFVVLHNGSYVPEEVPFLFSRAERKQEEDLHTLELYLPLFLEHGGTLVVPFGSRYWVDLNRTEDCAVLQYGTRYGEPNYDRKKLFPHREVRKRGIEYHRAFYAKLADLLGKDSIVFSGHSMRPYEKEVPSAKEATAKMRMSDGEKRPQFCLISHDDGLDYAIALQKLFAEHGLLDTRINDPFNYGMYESTGAGHFGIFAHDVCDVRHVFELETNKSFYLLPNLLGMSADFYHAAKNLKDAVSDYLHLLQREALVPVRKSA